MVLCAIKLLYEYTLQREWPTLKLVRAGKEYKLPVILSRAEVRRLLGCLNRAHYRVCLSTIYAGGLRLGEGAGLQVAHIDSARMQLHIHQGKGRKDRYVTLSHRLLGVLREYWKLERPGHWLFPGPDDRRPLTRASVHKFFKF